MKKTFDNYIEESLKSIQTTRRVMYPRGLELNDDFVNSFQKQFIKLREMGLSDHNILTRLKKSLDFYIPSE